MGLTTVGPGETERRVRIRRHLVDAYSAACVEYVAMQAVPWWRWLERRRRSRACDVQATRADWLRDRLNGTPSEAPGLRELLDLVNAHPERADELSYNVPRP